MDANAVCLLPNADAAQPLGRSVEQWVRILGEADWPVDARTAAAIEELAEIEDHVDAKTVAEAVEFDPLMTLKLLRHVAQSGMRRATDIETARAAVVLMGISPFFRTFGRQGSLQDAFVAVPQAQEGFDAVMRRARRAGQFALAFAVHLGEYDAPVIHGAAMLHDFAEMLMWLHAPQQSLAIAAQRQVQPTLRTDALQRHWYGAAMADVQHALMQHWHLPELLVRITDARHADAPPVRCVALAVRLARHTATSWQDPAIPDDVRDIAALLNLRIDPTLDLLKALEAE